MTKINCISLRKRSRKNLFEEFRSDSFTKMFLWPINDLDIEILIVLTSEKKNVSCLAAWRQRVHKVWRENMVDRVARARL